MHGRTDARPLTHSAPQYASTVHILILANHQNGKDTHLRGLRVFGPNPAAAAMPSAQATIATGGASLEAVAKVESAELDAHQLLPFGGGAENLWRVR
jgi:hypothetical protein